MSRERLYLFDTTLRDGAQTNGVDFTVHDKKVIASMLDDLGIDYVDKRNGMIDAVTIEDARRAAKRLFDASMLTFIVVGPAEEVQLPGAEVVKAPARN